jgi:NAD(P) transhydrogenase subunit beta
MPLTIEKLLYLLAAILFIVGLMRLSHPKTAVRGNMYGATGMLLAVLVTLFKAGIVTWGTIVLGLVIGTALGALLAAKIQMTEMPELVGLFNGLGGIASVLVAGAELSRQLAGMSPETGSFMDSTQVQFAIATGASGLIGAVTFTGSLVACGKLHGFKWIPDGAVIPGQTLLNGLMVVGGLGMIAWLTVATPASAMPYWAIVGVAFLLGITLTTPIGGADMPVVIALLNSYSGLAACATGFVIDNNVLIVSGSLVGASGLILTKIMCKAMNRSLANVLFAKMGPSSDSASADEVYGGRVKSTSAEELAMLVESVRKVVIVPGYGMAVAQAQHAVRDLANLLESRGAEVEYAIHPVAGRMPGHMNVLLAEANVPYEKLKSMEDINPTLEQVDLALVVGANDVVNPLARTDPASPIAGMPIIDVDKCQTVVVVKRSLSPGFAGIPNPLFAADNALMYFADGKKAFLDLIAAIKEND